MKRGTTDFANHLHSRTSTPPCIGCEHMVRCGELRLACEVFQSYVGAPKMLRPKRIPLRAIYDELFVDELFLRVGNLPQATGGVSVAEGELAAMTPTY